MGVELSSQDARTGVLFRDRLSDQKSLEVVAWTAQRLEIWRLSGILCVVGSVK